MSLKLKRVTKLRDCVCNSIFVLISVITDKPLTDVPGNKVSVVGFVLDVLGNKVSVVGVVLDVLGNKVSVVGVVLQRRNLYWKVTLDSLGMDH